MRKWSASLGVIRLTLVWMTMFFALGALLSLAIGFDPWWRLPSMGTAFGIAIPTRHLMDRHLARTPYDGNDRSRVIPRRTNYDD